MLGALAIAGLIIANFFAFSPAGPSTAQQFVADAAQRTRSLSPERIAQISQGYEDITRCLDEAAKSKTLRVLSAVAVDSLDGPIVPMQEQAARTYLTYDNPEHHRIVIALDARNAPVYAVDIDAATVRPSHKEQQTLTRQDAM